MTTVEPSAGQPERTDCACSGVRWCARCLDPEVRRARKLDDPLPRPELLGAAGCLRGGTEALAERVHRFDATLARAPSCASFRGVRVYPNLVSEAESKALLAEIEAAPFRPAQSGKQKQHYGPRINFNKRRVNARDFDGLPDYADFIESRMRERACSDAIGDSADRADLRRALDRFETTDVFVLRYRESEGSNLDFHRDDAFGYGEAILDLSLESDSCLTFVSFPRVHEEAAATPVEAARAMARSRETICVRVPLPARSGLLLYGAARFEWQHAILADDVEGQRTSLTLRTLGPTLSETETGRAVLERARSGRS